MFKLSRKKSIFIPILLVIPVLAVIIISAISLTKFTPVSYVSQNDFYDTKSPILQRCKVTDEVEYVYYQTIPKDKKKNNKFGLYIYAEQGEFFELAQNLVNSNGGDWGYVLIPYNVKDQDYEKWRNVFERLSEKHLIPVIQLWDIDPDDYKDQTEESAEFLNSFVWPVRPRYISAYNEMNDAKFWYGRVDPEEYARILDYTIEKYNEVNSDFFIMNGAFNISASDTTTSMDAVEYMQEMDNEVPGIFEKLDGWASHSYPQPNFTGSPYTKGRNGIRAYEFELEILKEQFGLDKTLPVFITETGWAHAEGDSYNSSYLSVAQAAENFRIAFEEIWLPDNRVVAVMPFTILYNPPHDHFSWVNADYVPYKHYETVKSLKKVSGTPDSIKESKFSYLDCTK